MLQQRSQSTSKNIDHVTPSDRFAEDNLRASLKRFLRTNACGGAI